MVRDFVHLHVHSEYSLLDGANPIYELVKQAQSLGMSSLAITDHGVLHGAIPFYKTCLQWGIKPILGVEAYVDEGDDYYHLILLAENMEGYQNLLKLVSKSHLEGFYYKPRMKKKWLQQYHNGIIGLSSCIGGEIPQWILKGKTEQALASALHFEQIFGKGNFFLELQDHGIQEQKEVNYWLTKISKRTGIPLVVTNDVHYLKKEDHRIQDVLMCIGTGKTIDTEDRMKFPTQEFYLKSAEEMERLFSHYPEALENTSHIARRCQLEIPMGKSILPRFHLPEQTSAEEFIREWCERGLKERYESVTDEIRSRLEYELSVIQSMGFSDYFLIVSDFVREARKRGIMVGPGRGSAAGSLVAYVLHITDIDPIQYGLLFERFLNPERVTMPDIDIDFSDERRDEVIRYVVEKYGSDRVAQIATFGTMAARAAIRDVGRALKLPYSLVDKTAKMIPLGIGVTIEKALRENEELRNWAQKDHQVKTLLSTAQKVEGMPRHVSTHAAGVVISREPLTDYVPLMKGNEGHALTQYSMDVLEDLGLLKMDLLGLRNLTVIEKTLNHLEEWQGISLQLKNIPFDDQKTYQLLGRGDTLGVFQLESSGMRNVLRELKPSHFEDIIAVLALYRPGPMEFIPQYIEGKYGRRKVTYPHSDLKEILEPTYGIIVYQEQIMQIASKMAGYSLGEADILRRAVGKKKREILDEQRNRFVTGSINKGYGKELANYVYDLILRFADYGFNRSHAAAYAVVAYQMAYLKANYPKPFMAALLSMVIGNQQKTAEYMEECKRLGIRLYPPDINKSHIQFIIENEGIRFGLAGIKHVGVHAIEEIIKERMKGPFKDLLDFCMRINQRSCNKKSIECLILSGAFDSLPGHRAQKLASLEEMIQFSHNWKKKQLLDQMILFDEETSGFPVLYEDIPPFSKREELTHERELLGLYLSGHPLDNYSKITRDFDSIHHLHEKKDGEWVKVAGLVLEVKSITTKKGEKMAFLLLEDKMGQVEVTIFPREYQKNQHVLNRDVPLIVEGRVHHTEETVKITANRLFSLEEKQKELFVRIPKDLKQTESLRKLQQLLKQQEKGNVPIYLYYEMTGKVRRLSPDYDIQLSPRLVEKVEEILGKGAAVVRII
ncbi:DNA polymerase III subunit alpha [Microaerobacter geothermalis]|uniref:DNA polymerase III subunit alpha n=1 Tax=Microaerobacter geothermalis TaxID=674972 RepID=UPI001F28BFAD|nr:DNA polymerase III subunit alpha [Microaerobacter geothermalis]MCF6094628.1 DNA polymerase III subunit alpha [Microaerobacter geothermalis]